MSTVLALLSHSIQVAMFFVLTGISVRGRGRLCLTFPAYLLLVLTCDTAVLLWPQRLYAAMRCEHCHYATIT